MIRFRLTIFLYVFVNRRYPDSGHPELDKVVQLCDNAVQSAIMDQIVRRVSGFLILAKKSGLSPRSR
jgi:hypothetical protein